MSTVSEILPVAAVGGSPTTSSQGSGGGGGGGSGGGGGGGCSSVGSCGPKTGRKGDPRMHRAVAARLSDPNMSLFEALKRGGFDYATDEDAGLMDSEHVTLGQRKNQLSRRLRLARSKNNNSSQQQQQQQHLQYQDHQQQINLGAGSNYGLTQELGAPGTAVQNEGQTTTTTLLSTVAGMKRSLSPTSHSAAAAAAIEEESAVERTRRMAKFHPDYHPIIVPPARAVANLNKLQKSNGSSGSTGTASGATVIPGMAAAPTAAGFPSGLTVFGAPASAATANGLPCFFPMLSGISATAVGHAPSAVAVSSLNHTAHSVGLTLEQLAVALSSSKSLHEVLSGTCGSSNGSDSKTGEQSGKSNAVSGSITDASNSPRSEEEQRSKQEQLALNLFQNESRSLYQKCMLLAGYTPDEAFEGSTRHVRFSVAAWQTEGKRLQDVLKERGESIEELEAPLIVNAADPPSASHQHHDHQAPVVDDSECVDGAAAGCVKAQESTDRGNDSEQRQQQKRQPAKQCHQPITWLEGRHVHRLDGKCGHKAILHKPDPNGPAHIDFVVGDRVECYHGLPPVAPPNTSEVGVWVSKFKCQDLSCRKQCNQMFLGAARGEVQHSAPSPAGSGHGGDDDDDGAAGANSSEPKNRGGSPAEEQQRFADPAAPPPIPCPCENVTKILNLHDLDLQGEEWNHIGDGHIDETLQGMFKLGGGDSSVGGMTTTFSEIGGD